MVVNFTFCKWIMNVKTEDLNRLGDEKFERLVKSLLFKVIGKGVTPFSKGKDGAREATFIGTAPYPSESEQWTGHWIFQVKYAEIGCGIKEARDRVKYLIGSELKKINGYGYIKNNICDNYIYIVNVPFSGTFQTGLHDYISTKKKQYKIKNFDYWDGEKVCRYLDVYSDIRMTFFPNDGVYSVDQDEINLIKEIYVPPAQYPSLKADLLEHHMVSIIGQPHVGKTTTSYYMASELYEELRLSNILVVPIIDDLSYIPKIANSIVVFDDLFGETKFQSIGKKSKVISSLLRSNFVIVTSRSHIFAKAKKDEELSEYIQENEGRLIQEGSYSTQTLKSILIKHLSRKLRLGTISKISFDFVMTFQDMIVNALRFPHNIAVFVTEFSNSCHSKRLVKNVVAKSRRIESVALSWMGAFNDNDISILAALSLGRTLNIDQAQQLLYDIDTAALEDFLEKSTKLIALEGSEFKFRHPSYRSAYFNYFKQKRRDMSRLLVEMIFSHEKLPSSFKRKYLSIFQEIISDISTDKLIQILATKNVNYDTKQIIWANLIKRIPERVVDLYLQLRSRRESKKLPKSLITSKDHLKKKDIITFFEILFPERYKHNTRVIDSLIVYFSYGIRDRLDPFIETLDEVKMDQILLKLALLGSKGSLIGEKVLPEIFKFFNNKSNKVRRKAYAAFNSVNFHSISKYEEYILHMQCVETSNQNKKKLMKIVDRIGRESHKRS